MLKKDKMILYFKALDFVQYLYISTKITKIEMNRSLTKHRKISSSFRDTQLLEIFTLSCNLLKEANNNIKLIFNGSSTKQEEKFLISHLLQLSLNCLLFDFIGTTSSDETSDDLSTVQIPTSWRSGLFPEQ